MTALTAMLSITYGAGMAVMTIRGLDDSVRDKLRLRAAQHGRSMEAEARAILEAAVSSPVERSFSDALLDLAQAAKGTGFTVPDRIRDERARDPFQ
jgi:plasmid stability protein